MLARICFELIVFLFFGLQRKKIMYKIILFFFFSDKKILKNIREILIDRENEVCSFVKLSQKNRREEEKCVKISVHIVI